MMVEYKNSYLCSRCDGQANISVRDGGVDSKGFCFSDVCCTVGIPTSTFKKKIGWWATA